MANMINEDKGYITDVPAGMVPEDFISVENLTKASHEMPPGALHESPADAGVFVVEAATLIRADDQEAAERKILSLLGAAGGNPTVKARGATVKDLAQFSGTGGKNDPGLERQKEAAAAADDDGE